MEQSNRTTTVKPGASSGESAIALLQHAVEALRNHPQDAHAGLVAGRIVNYLKTFPTHAVVAYLVKGEGDQEAVLHMVASNEWPAWAKRHRCWNEGATTEETGEAFTHGYLTGYDDAGLVDRETPAPAQDGLALIAAERRRQVEVEGWTAEHDDEHDDHQLSQAAACYALGLPYAIGGDGQRVELWPWDMTWWKRKDRVHDLARAGALIAAEIDRIRRVEAPGAAS